MRACSPLLTVTLWSLVCFSPIPSDAADDLWPKWQLLFPEFKGAEEFQAWDILTERYETNWLEENPEVDLKNVVSAIGSLKKHFKKERKLELYFDAVVQLALKESKRHPSPGLLTWLGVEVEPRWLHHRYGERLVKLRNRVESEFWRREIEQFFFETTFTDFMQLPAALNRGSQLSEPQRTQLKRTKVTSIYFEDEGERTRTVSKVAMNLLDAKSLATIESQSLEAYNVQSIRPDGRQMLSAHEGKFEIIDFETGATLTNVETDHANQDIEGVHWFGDDIVMIHVGRKSPSMLRLITGTNAISDNPIQHDDVLFLSSRSRNLYRSLVSVKDGVLYQIGTKADELTVGGPMQIRTFSLPKVELLNSRVYPEITGDYFRIFGQVPRSDLLYFGYDGFGVFNPDNGVVHWRRLFALHERYIDTYDISDNGRWLAMLVYDGDVLNSVRQLPDYWSTTTMAIIQIIDMQTGSTVLALYPQRTEDYEHGDYRANKAIEYASCLALGDDGSRLAVGYDTGVVAVWDLPDLNELAKSELKPMPVSEWGAVFP